MEDHTAAGNSCIHVLRVYEWGSFSVFYERYPFPLLGLPEHGHFAFRVVA